MTVIIIVHNISNKHKLCQGRWFRWMYTIGITILKW